MVYTNALQFRGEGAVLFEWDEHKRQECISKHGVDLMFAASIFDGETVTWQDRRYEYEELRFCAVGVIEGQHYVVVFTWRGDAIRLISARKGGRRDRQRYQDRFIGRISGDAEKG